MKYNKLDFNPSRDQEEFKEDILLSLMKEFTISFPQEQQINDTINQLRQYIPNKQQQKHRVLNKVLLLMKYSMSEVSLMSKSYWVASLILFTLGYIIISLTYVNPYGTMLVLSPLPFIAGLLEVFKGREEGMWEIELTCKISVQEILMSKLIIIGLYNIVLNTILSLLAKGFWPTVIIWRIMLVWIAPLVLICAICLFISKIIRVIYVVPIMMAIWIGAATLALSVPRLREILISVHLGVYGIVLMAGMILSYTQIKSLTDKYFVERGVLVEINN